MGKRYGKSKILNETNWECKHCCCTIDDETDNSIECWECYNWFHIECTPLDRKKFIEIINKNQSWICSTCSSKNGNVFITMEPEIIQLSYEDQNELSMEIIEVIPEADAKEVSISPLPLKCLRCLINLTNSTYQNVFDDTGKELGLQKLLSECFDIDIKEDEEEIQVLCNECLNELIETYDLMQREINATKISATEPSKNIEIKTEILNSDDEDFSQINDKDEDFEIINEESSNVVGIDNKNDLDENEFENVFYLDDYDEVLDFRAYKQKVIKNHKFNEVLFPNPIQCRICSESLSNHIKIIEHTQNVHSNNNDQQYFCVIDENCEPLNTIEDLSYHLVFKHYDLNELVIIAECPECNKLFENFLTYNKHCCDTAKRYSRSTVECEECGKYFKSNKRYRFHLQFHLEKRRPKACLICDIMFRDEDEFFEHVRYEHEKNKENICKSCDLVFTTQENLNIHIVSSHGSGRSYNSCPTCFKLFSSQQHLRQHMAIHDKTRFKCHICGKCLSRKSRLNKHLIRHQNPTEQDVMSCTVCGFVAANEENAESHLLEHDEHNASVEIETLLIAYICEFCDLSFNTIENLLKHRKSSHPTNEYLCPICDFKNTKYSTITCHKLSHSKYKSMVEEFPVRKHYVCGTLNCTKSYPLWTSLNLHKIKNHETRVRKDNLNCIKCKINFSTFFQYKNHMTENHAGKSIFDCSFCDKSFRIKSALTLHTKKGHRKPIDVKIQKKKNEKKTPNIIMKDPNQQKSILPQKGHGLPDQPRTKDFHCNICDKPFYNRSDALVHERAVHAKEVKFFCPTCSFKTPYRQTLTYHLKTHKNEYPYECSICSRKFRFKNSHKLHEQRHQNVRNYVCNIDGCRLSYINIGRLKTHQKLKHTPGVKYTKATKRFYNINAYTDRFVDDDDGLDDGVIGEPSSSSTTITTTSHKQNQQNNNPQPYTKIIQLENFVNSNDNIEIICEKNMINQEDNPDDPSSVYFNLEEVEEVEEINEEQKMINYNQNNENNTIKPVLIIRNNDYIMELDHTKIYGNALEVTNIQETEVGATEIVGE